MIHEPEEFDPENDRLSSSQRVLTVDALTSSSKKPTSSVGLGFRALPHLFLQHPFYQTTPHIPNALQIRCWGCRNDPHLVALQGLNRSLAALLSTIVTMFFSIVLCVPPKYYTSFHFFSILCMSPTYYSNETLKGAHIWEPRIQRPYEKLREP